MTAETHKCTWAKPTRRRASPRRRAKSSGSWRRERSTSPTGLAILRSALGEHEQAFALLERAYSAHDQQLVWIGVEAAYNPQLRSDPRFQDLLRRIGLGSNLAARER